MKNFIFRSLKFLVFFAVYFVLVNAIFLGIIISTDWDFRNRLESLRFNDPDFELLVVGASTSFDGIDTELLSSNGIKSYNLAMGGTSVMTSYIELNEYLENYSSRPRYVILGLNAPMVTTFDDETIHPIIEVTMSDHDFNINDIPILKFKWLAFELIKKVISKSHRNARLSFGQLKFQKIIPDTTSYIDQYLDVDEYESSKWIGEIVKFCDQNEIELLLLEMPGYKLTQNLSETGSHTIYLRNGYSARLYNYNSREFCEIFDPDKDWIGNSHLNEFGAIKFTKELISLLKELENNPDS